MSFRGIRSNPHHTKLLFAACHAHLCMCRTSRKLPRPFFSPLPSFHSPRQVPSGVTVATANCSSNIAVIKYWGKRDENLILPINSSLSVTMDPAQVAHPLFSHVSGSCTSSSLLQASFPTLPSPASPDATSACKLLLFARCSLWPEPLPPLLSFSSFVIPGWENVRRAYELIHRPGPNRWARRRQLLPRRPGRTTGCGSTARRRTPGRSVSKTACRPSGKWRCRESYHSILITSSCQPQPSRLARCAECLRSLAGPLRAQGRPAYRVEQQLPDRGRARLIGLWVRLPGPRPRQALRHRPRQSFGRVAPRVGERVPQRCVTCSMLCPCLHS